MNPTRRRLNEMPTTAKAAVVTLLALLLSHVIIYDLTSVSFFSPMEKASDFRFSDFYTLVANDRAVRTLDPDVVIVAVDGCNRREIARTLDDIDFCAPAAVGLDIAFTAPSDPDDDPLRDALAACENLVMPVVAYEDGASAVKSYYDSVVTPSGGFACVNIEGEAGSRATVRDFRPLFGSESSPLPSLPLALAALARPEAAETLMARGNADEAISYASREFNVIRHDSVIDCADLLEGRAVLVGKLSDAADMHSTPLGNFTPGILIHAYTLSTILSGDYTRRLTAAEVTLIAIAVCFLVSWINLRVGNTALGTFAVRSVQFLLLYCMIQAGTQAFIRWNIDLNFAYVMLTTSVALVACDVYNGIFDEDGLLRMLPKWVNSIRNRYEDFRKKSKPNGDTAAVGDFDNATDC